jgi:hypothetical protein
MQTHNQHLLQKLKLIGTITRNSTINHNQFSHVPSKDTKTRQQFDSNHLNPTFRSENLSLMA